MRSSFIDLFIKNQLCHQYRLICMDWNIVVLMNNIIAFLNSYAVKIIALVKVENIHLQSNRYKI